MSKLDVAKSHIETAVLLQSLRADTRSIHVLVMAADELIGAFARSTSKVLPMDIDGMVVEDKRKEWFAAKNKAYNYFKHADRDAQADYSGPDLEKLLTLNDLTIMKAVINLRSLGVTCNLAARAHISGMMLLHPTMFHWDSMIFDGPLNRQQLESVSTQTTRDQLDITALAMLIATNAISLGDIETAIVLSRNVDPH